MRGASEFAVPHRKSLGAFEFELPDNLRDSYHSSWIRGRHEIPTGPASERVASRLILRIGARREFRRYWVTTTVLESTQND